MRCLALAQAWQDTGGEAVFVIVEPSQSIRDRLYSEKMEVVSIEVQPGGCDDAIYMTGLANQRTATWVAVDGYHFGADYQQVLKAAGLHILFLDDNVHASHYFGDVIVNQNVHADESLYPNREPYTQLLLGPHYCMLRREFNPWREWIREIPAVARRVLIVMGGSDPDNFTESVMRVLLSAQVEGLETTVAVGGSNPHGMSLQKVASGVDNSIHFRRDVSDMAELMAEADAAVSAAGTTCWELCFLGLPTILIDVAENQRALAQELHKQGCAIHLGSLRDVSAEKVAARLEQLLNSSETRRSLSQHARQLVDGEGAKRVVSFLQRKNHGLQSA